MRIRTIKPEFFTHEALFDAEKETGLPLRIAFSGLWCASDREGRFKWEPRRLGVSILPYDEIDFSRVLHALVTRGFIIKYRVGSMWYGAIPSWKKHQFVNPRETASEIPDHTNADEVDSSTTRPTRVPHACSKEGKEGKGTSIGRQEGGEKEKARNLYFDALARSCGIDPLQMTTPDAKACGVALAAIRKAAPSLEVEEIDKRAINYRTHFPDAALTPNALCKHWSLCANPKINGTHQHINPRLTSLAGDYSGITDK